MVFYFREKTTVYIWSPFFLFLSGVLTRREERKEDSAIAITRKHAVPRNKSQGFVTSSRDATLPTRAITVSLLWLQCTIASSTPTVHSLRPVANVRGGLFICLLFVVYLLYIFNSHYLRSHFTFLLLNTFLSIAYFAWGGVIYPVLCLAMPGLIYIPPSDMSMFVTCGL